jgi:hypothetical protein
MDYREILSRDEIASVLRYDEETGKLYWMITPARNVRAGSEAGVAKATRKSKTGEAISYRYIRYKGFNIPAAQLAWLLYHGEWPIGRVTNKDGNTLNLSADNLDMQNTADGKFDHSSREGRNAYLKSHREKNPLAWKETYLQQSFGITLQEYGEKLVEQAGKCAICDQPESHMRNGKVKALAVDHCHSTGKIRGLLCSDCNTGIGKLKDNPAVLQSAIGYILKHRE